jgi:hypothetical protein
VPCLAGRPIRRLEAVVSGARGGGAGRIPGTTEIVPRGGVAVSKEGKKFVSVCGVGRAGQEEAGRGYLQSGRRGSGFFFRFGRARGSVWKGEVRKGQTDTWYKATRGCE